MFGFGSNSLRVRFGSVRVRSIRQLGSYRSVKFVHLVSVQHFCLSVGFSMVVVVVVVLFAKNAYLRLLDFYLAQTNVDK